MRAIRVLAAIVLAALLLAACSTQEPREESQQEPERESSAVSQSSSRSSASEEESREEEDPESETSSEIPSTPSSAQASSGTAVPSQAPAVSPPVLRAEKSSYPVGTETIELSLAYFGPGEGGVGFDYHVERKMSGDQWERLQLDHEWIDLLHILQPGDIWGVTVSLYPSQYGYQPGMYRVVKQVSDSEKSHTVAAEFELTGEASPAASPADSQPSVLACTASGYKTGTEQIEVVLTYNGSGDGSADYYYTIERQNANSQWIPLGLDFAVMDVALILQPGDTSRFQIHLYPDQYSYTAGNYRVVKTISDGVSSHTLYAPFILDELDR